MGQPHGALESVTGQPSSPHVLIVDDDTDIREVLDLIFREEGYTTTTCATSKVALTVLQSQPVHLLITDLRLPGGGGGGLIRHVAATPEPRPQVILLTAMRATNVPAEVAVLQTIGGRIITKPFDVEALLTCARELTGWPGSGTSSK